MTPDAEPSSPRDTRTDPALQGARDALGAMSRPSFVLWGEEGRFFPNPVFREHFPQWEAPLRAAIRQLEDRSAATAREFAFTLPESLGASTVGVRLHPLRDAGGNPAGQVGELMVSAAASTSFPAEFHADLLAGIPHLVWLADEAGEIVYMSEQASLFSGLERNAAGKFYWTGVVHPEDLETTETLWREALEHSADYVCEHRLQLRSGVYRWFRSRAVHQPRAGGGENWFGTATDIQTEVEATDALRESEARFRALADGLPLPIWVHDAAGKQLFVNQTYCDYFGVSEGEMTGERWKSLVHPDDFEAYVGHFETCVNERRRFEAEVRVRRAGDDRWHHLASWGQPLRGADGAFSGFVGASADITERKRMEEELEAAREAAEASNRAKGDFLANMSHEIRTPMTSILGYTDILRQRMPDEESRESAEIILRNGRYLLELINDILDLSRIEVNRLEIHRKTVCPFTFVGEVVRLLEPKAAEKGLSLALAIETPMPEKVRLDPVRVRQVLINLIGNAIKFTPEGSVTLRLRCRESGDLCWRVEDTGIGIPEAERERLFEPFQQADNSAARRGEGAGLGLAICRRLVDRMGGTLDFESVEGEGTIFFWELPDCVPEKTVWLDEVPVAQDVSPPSRSKPLPRLEGLFLVVDDRPEVRRLHERQIQSAGGFTVAAESGQEALELWLKQRSRGGAWKGILMDVQMPEMDGLETTRRLRREGCEIPILALTARAMEGDEAVCREAGCDAYLAKPVLPQKLIECLRSLSREGAPTPSSAQAVSEEAPIRLLIVEDSESLLSVLKQFFARSGFTTETASSVDEALEVARRFEPAVVLADLGLPGRSGLELPARFEEIPGQTQVRFVALSGRDEPGDRQLSLDRGFADHLVKPPDFAYLQTRLRELAAEVRGNPS